MFHLQEIVHLDTQETVICMFRSHPFKMISQVIPCMGSLIVLFLFIFPLFSLGALGVCIFLLLFFSGVFFLSRNIFNWLGTYCILTNRRLLCIQRSGFFKKQAQEILLENITELSYTTKGMVQTLFHFGDVRLALVTARGEFTIPHIAKPQAILDILSRQASAVRKRKPPQTFSGTLPVHENREDMEKEDLLTVSPSNPTEKNRKDFKE